MRTFNIEAHHGRANIKAMASSDKIDAMVAWWSEQLEKIKITEPDDRQASKDLVIECLKTNKHHNDLVAAEMVCAALVWMTVTSELGVKVVPFMQAGGMTVIYEITHIEGNTYNFRTKFDEKTDRSLAL